MLETKRLLPRIVGSSDKTCNPSEKLKLGSRAAQAVDHTEAFETRPSFTSSWLSDTVVHDCLVAKYQVSGVEVRVASPEGASYGMYVINPPEYALNPLHLRIVSEVMEEIVTDLPEGLDMSSLETIRPHLFSRARDLLYRKLAARSDSDAEPRELENTTAFLAYVLCKYTAGFGIFETVLQDPNVQDIYVDSPSSQNPVHVVLRSNLAQGVRQKCRTNLYVGRRDLLSIVSRIKLETSLPFSEANPILEADLPHLGVRVTIVGPPLSERGVAMAFRKHSEAILPLSTLTANSTLTPLLASFLWASVIGRRTVLISGSRGAGKTTLMSSLVLEFPRSQRIILIEDTPEIPLRRFQELGYDVQGLRFKAHRGNALASAEESLRVSLRMGESAIVLGEVRGVEARVLYESMRAGSAGSSVLGTIHGNSAKAVLDRTVEDLGVSERAFSATDLIVVMGLIRSPDGTSFQRRVSEVVEVREDGRGVCLVPLFEPTSSSSCARPTEHFAPSSKTVRAIAASFGISPDRTMEIIRLRAYAEQAMAERVQSRPQTLGTDWESLRLRWNEHLMQQLFSGAVTEQPADIWERWLDEQMGTP